MNKKFFLMSIMTIFVLNTSAQVKWGLYGGGSIIGYKNFSSDKGSVLTFNTNFSNSSAVNYGFFLEFEAFQKIKLETGLTSGYKGFEVVEKVVNVYEGPLNTSGVPVWKYTSSANYNYTYKMPYISIPILLNYYLVNKKFKFYVSFGQKIGLCFNSTTTNFLLSSSGSGYGSIPSQVMVVKNELPNFDIEVGSDGMFRALQYDIVFGGGVALGRFYIVYNYDYGVLNNSHIDFLKMRSRSHNISLRIDFSTKR